MADEQDDIEAAFATRVLLEEGKKSPGALGIHEILRFLSEPDYQLTPPQQAALFSRPALRATFQALKRRYALLAMPTLAAASTGEVNERHFEGGWVRLTASLENTFVYALITFEDDRAPQGPSILLLEASDGTMSKLLLGVPNSERQVFVGIDGGTEPGSTTLTLLRNVDASGSFLGLRDE